MRILWVPEWMRWLPRHKPEGLYSRADVKRLWDESVR